MRCVVSHKRNLCLSREAERELKSQIKCVFNRNPWKLSIFMRVVSTNMSCFKVWITITCAKIKKMHLQIDLVTNLLACFKSSSNKKRCWNQNVKYKKKSKTCFNFRTCYYVGVCSENFYNKHSWINPHISHNKSCSLRGQTSFFYILLFQKISKSGEFVIKRCT